MTFEIKNGLLGARLIPSGSWSEQMATAFRSSGCTELELNSGKGWQDSSLQFLKDLSNLRVLIVRSPFVRECAQIAELKSLVVLELDSNCKGSINFAAFEGLIDCGFNWRSCGSTIFSAFGLRRLYINRFPGSDLSPFAGLGLLRELVLLGSKLESLEGIEALSKLQYLRVGLAKKLRHISQLGSLQDLERLEFNQCKSIEDVASIKSAKRLKRLELIDCGDIPDIEWIASLSSLEEFYFSGTTRIVSGDLSPLLSLRNLRRTAFASRRHYSHGKDSFPS